MSINLRFDEEKRAGIEQGWTDWWAGELERPMVLIYDLDRVQSTAEDYTRKMLVDTPIDEVVDIFQSRLEGARYAADTMPTFSTFNFDVDSDSAKFSPEHGTVWYEVEEPIPFEDIHVARNPNLLETRGMQLVIKAVERWGGKVAVDPCAHYTGAGINTLIRSRTTDQTLSDLYESPEEVARLSQEYADVSMRHYEESCDVIEKVGGGTSNFMHLWSPGRTCMLQCDFSAMISAKMFERFILPDLNRCTGAPDHAFYHLDGPGAIRHLDMLLALERLRGIEWTPPPQKGRAADWMPLLKRIRDAGKLCLIRADLDGARQVVREIGGKSFCFKIYQTPAQMPDEEVDDFLAVLAADDINRN